MAFLCLELPVDVLDGLEYCRKMWIIIIIIIIAFSYCDDPV
jgi:hypothetical protein